MEKDKLIEELVAALDEAGKALAVAERETMSETKGDQYRQAMERASNAILKARKRGN